MEGGNGKERKKGEQKICAKNEKKRRKEDYFKFILIFRSPVLVTVKQEIIRPLQHSDSGDDILNDDDITKKNDVSKADDAILFSFEPDYNYDYLYNDIEHDREILAGQREQVANAGELFSAFFKTWQWRKIWGKFVHEFRSIYP